jgi:transposase-like protein
VIEGGLSKAAAARRFNTTPNTVAKWVDRFRADDVAGLQDRSSWPRSSPSQASDMPTQISSMTLTLGG